MVQYTCRIIKLIFGLFLFALGIAITMRANLGFAPWDVFHQGIAQNIGITIGRVTILVGLFICVLTALLGERLGIGTLLNMLLIGLFLDWILSLGIIPLMNSFISGVFMMTTGLFVIALASFFYIGAGFGAGPRDALMVATERKTGLPVGVARAITEGAAVFFGWVLGGPVGLGTVIAAFGIGFCVQIVFSLLRFDPAEIDHETVTKTFRSLKASL